MWTTEFLRSEILQDIKITLYVVDKGFHYVKALSDHKFGNCSLMRCDMHQPKRFALIVISFNEINLLSDFSHFIVDRLIN